MGTFRKLVPLSQGLIFAVPNGGARSKATAGKLKAEGVLAGVSDLIVAYSGGVCFLEVKRARAKGVSAGRQTSSQMEFAYIVTRLGHRYAVVATLDDFLKVLVELGLAPRSAVRPGCLSTPPTTLPDSNRP